MNISEVFWHCKEKLIPLKIGLSSEIGQFFSEEKPAAKAVRAPLLGAAPATGGDMFIYPFQNCRSACCKGLHPISFPD